MSEYEIHPRRRQHLGLDPMPLTAPEGSTAGTEPDLEAVQDESSRRQDRGERLSRLSSRKDKARQVLDSDGGFSPKERDEILAALVLELLGD